MGAEHKGKGVNVQVRRRYFSPERGYIGGEGQLTSSVVIYHAIARTYDEYGTGSCWWKELGGLWRRGESDARKISKGD